MQLLTVLTQAIFKLTLIILWREGQLQVYVDAWLTGCDIE